MRLGGPEVSKHRTHLRRRRVVRMVAPLVVISLLVVGAAAGYSWYTSQQQAIEPELPVVVAKTPQPQSAPTPAKDAPVSIVVQSLASPAAPGKNSALTIKTLTGAACRIDFTYNDTEKRSKDSGLVPKVADEFGLVEWTWTVTADVQPGTWPVEVTCALGSKSAYSRSDLVVAAP